MTLSATTPKTNTTALVAALAGLFGFCFWGVGGVIAIVLGVSARSEIRRAAGNEGGSSLALVGIVLGSVNVASAVIALGVALAVILRPTPASGPTIAAPAVTARAPAPASSSGAPTESVSRESGIRETVVGAVRLIDIRQPELAFRQVLQKQQREATTQHERLLLFVVSSNCLPCNGVTLALNDRKMQAALAGVRVVRLDVAEFGPELAALGIPTETVPGFVLFEGDLRPSDYVHGGEWDADIAENIAPVLGPFVRGKYTARRHPYRAERPDETAL